MEFNISYYNGYGDDDICKLENSIKAAYLYADNVNLYNNIFIVYPFLESLNRITWKNDPFFNRDAKYLLQLNKEELYKLNQYEQYLLLEHIDRELLLLQKKIFEEYYNKNIEEIIHSDIFRLVKIQHIDIKEVNFINDIIKACVNEIMSSSDFRMINKSEQNLFSKFEQSSNNNSNSVNLANFILTQLPAFDIATVDEIIDIKKELSKYIIPFRKAIFDLSDKLSDAPEQDFESACNKIYHSEIAPKINEIEQAIRDNHILKNIAANVFTDPEFWAGVGSLTVACTNGNNILSSISAAGSIGFLGASLGKTIQEHRENIKNIKANELYFYYKVGEKIKK